MDRVFIIAEAGVNHNGSVEIAKKLVDAAKDAGSDAVKFQTFKSEKTVSIFAAKAEYQKGTTDESETQLEMVKKLELDMNEHREIMSYCNQKGIMFFSTPFDLESVDMLNVLGLGVFKIASGEITNLKLLEKIGSLNREIILSTGMADLTEIKDALTVLNEAGTPREKITILHCNTEYPTSMEDVNLLAMQTINKAFNTRVGYSDHTTGIEISVAAVALGATVIEKHITIDKNMNGPDHKSSLDPREFKEMVMAIRNIEVALGDGVKRASLSELKNKNIARKSIVAANDIKLGEIFSESNITIKRPGCGVNPMKWYNVIGEVAKRDFKEDEAIEL
tara:strand:+ start:150 stop:1154 length:1005 start_codon:yes stop_codon:yes gene_type:complete